MKLFVLKPDHQLIDDHQSHYNKLVKTGLVEVIEEIDDQWRYGFVFRGTDSLNKNNSRYFDPDHFKYSFIERSTLPLFNKDFAILDSSFFQEPLRRDSFVKPNNKLKAFQPTILKKGEPINNLGLSPETVKGLEVILASVKDMTNVVEVRAIVFNNSLCSIAVSSHEDKNIKIHSDVYKFALKAMRSYPECFAYALDIAVTNEKECSIMEINPIETSGFFIEDYTRLLTIFKNYEPIE